MAFALDLRKFREKTEKRTKDAFHKIALDIDRGVVLSTPVDTGRARGAWNVGINNVNLEETTLSPKKSIAGKVSEDEATIKTAENGDVIFISNNVDYIQYLEEGSSDQAPIGMVAKTLRRMPQIVRESVSASKRENP